MDRDLHAFAQRIRDEVQDRLETGTSDSGETYSESIFTEVVAEHLASIGMFESAEVCHHEGMHGRGGIKINGYYLADDRNKLDLLVAIYHATSESKTTTREEVQKSAERAARFFQASIEGLYQKLEPSGEAFEISRAIQEAAGTIEEVRVFIITDGLSTVKKLESTEAAGTPVRFEVWDVERLFRGMLAGIPRDEIEVDFAKIGDGPIPCLVAPQNNADFKAYLAVLPGNLLYKLYDEYGPRLLELNVRAFLGVRGSKTVNSGIRKTLKEEPSRFAAYNNGIVLTADALNIQTQPNGQLVIHSAKGLQIVNGGQTTASIHRARKHDDDFDISSVYVPAKIITVTDPKRLDQIVQMISHYANSQNTVQPADFSANDPFHVKLEELSSAVWCPDGQSRWFYERARGSYQVAMTREGSTPAALRRFKERTPSQRRFTKPEMAKYVNSWDQKPNLVSYGAQKNFDYFMQGLRGRAGEDWLPDQTYYRQLIAKTILFRAIQKIVKAEKFPAHQANISAYLMAYLSWRTSQAIDLEGIWQAQRISEELQTMLRTWSHGIDDCLRKTAGGRMVSEWSKREPCWEGIRELALELPESLPPELSSRLVTATSSGSARRSSYAENLTAEDFRNIERCKLVTGEEWLRIHAWGIKSGELKKWQYGIAHTLAGYAAASWERGPSPKQARQGIVIIAAAKAAGIIHSNTHTISSS